MISFRWFIRCTVNLQIIFKFSASMHCMTSLGDWHSWSLMTHLLKGTLCLWTWPWSLDYDYSRSIYCRLMSSKETTHNTLVLSINSHRFSSLFSCHQMTTCFNSSIHATQRAGKVLILALNEVFCETILKFD